MSTKHAAALAALDAGCEVLRGAVGQFVAFRDEDDRYRKKIGVGGTPLDALAAAAEALGLEVKYCVFSLDTCFRCGRKGIGIALVYGWNEAARRYGFVCADGCPDKEGAVKP